MIAITNKVASDRSIKVWVVPETVPGELAYPESEHYISAFEMTHPNQTPEYTNSKERGSTRDVLNRCQGQMPAGEFAFSTYCRPAGLGVPPAESELLIALLGKETIDVGASVSYDPQIEKSSVSVWFLEDHTMLFARGATISEGVLSLEDCTVTWNWSGMFMAMGVVGTDPLGALVAPAATEVTVTEIDKFSTGGKFVLADAAGEIVDDNGGDGYTIDTVDYDTDLIQTVEAIAIGAAADGFIAPFDPGGSVEGNPLEVRGSTVTVNGVVKPFVTFELSLKDEPEYLDREKTPSGYPETYAPMQREITGTLTLLFYRDEADQFVKRLRGDETPIIAVMGDLPGYILTATGQRATLEVPTLEEEEPTINMVMPFTCLATNGEDSMGLVYT